MVTCRNAWQQARDQLRKAQVPEPEADADLLLELAAGRDWRWRDAPLTDAEHQNLEALVQKRVQRWPIQYLAGRWPFWDLELEVGPGVLTPRADTEVVCEAAIQKIADCTAPAVLDLCAGSGALGLVVKRMVPDAQVTLLEKSPDAFSYLERNCRLAVLNQTPPAPKPVQGDLFGYEKQLSDGKLDLIVSNPPYLTGNEMTQLQPEVAFEPAMALDGGDDGLRFYRYLAAHYQSALRPGGWLVMEIGWQQRAAVEELLRQSGWVNVSGCRDYGQNDRAVWGQRPFIDPKTEK